MLINQRDKVLSEMLQKRVLHYFKEEKVATRDGSKEEKKEAKEARGDKHMCLSARWIEFVSELQ